MSILIWDFLCISRYSYDLPNSSLGKMENSRDVKNIMKEEKESENV